MSSFENVLRAVTEMVEQPTPNFTEIRKLVEPRLCEWSADEVRRLLEVKRMSDTTDTLRWALKQPDAIDKSAGGLKEFIRYNNSLRNSQKRKGGGNNQRVRLVLRILKRLGEYDGFGTDKAAR